MNTVIEYLKDPMKSGVYNHKCIVDFSGMKEYLTQLAEKIRKSKAQVKIKVGLISYKRSLSSLESALEEFEEVDIERSGDRLFKDLNKIFHALSRFEEFPEPISKHFSLRRPMHSLSGEVITVRRSILRPSDPFGSRITTEANDALAVGRKRIGKGKWMFDIVALKKEGLSEFKSKIKCIPALKKGMKKLKENKQHSARYTFRPYPLATKLWLKDEASILLHADLKGFLEGAIDYFFSSEWRTSIVLSAITVESVLADLYEEKCKEPAPDKPLGELFRLVKENAELPAKVESAIDTTNKSRISAVHRSRHPVGSREAIYAMYGAVNASIWYVSQY